MKSKIGFGGSCHWCTEAIFRSVVGVTQVEQGWLKSTSPHHEFSEGVIVYFDKEKITLDILIQMHLHTHHCTSKHSMRQKYRSAVYTINKDQTDKAKLSLRNAQSDFSERIITEVVSLIDFKLNDPRYLDYYYNNPDKPFCQTYINPKLKMLMVKFSSQVKDLELD